MSQTTAPHTAIGIPPLAIMHLQHLQYSPNQVINAAPSSPKKKHGGRLGTSRHHGHNYNQDSPQNRRFAPGIPEFFPGKRLRHHQVHLLCSCHAICCSTTPLVFPALERFRFAGSWSHEIKPSRVSLAKGSPAATRSWHFSLVSSIIHNYTSSPQRRLRSDDLGSSFE